MVNEEVKVFGLIAFVLLLAFILFRTFTPIKNAVASIFASTPSLTVRVDDVTTNGKFDPTKFNNRYNEIKTQKRDMLKKVEEDRLRKLEEMNKRDDTQSILGMRVYDLMVDYTTTVYGISRDVVEGKPWLYGNRMLYFGWTLVMISIVYFLVNNI
jgi:hypothetical protein